MPEETQSIESGEMKTYEVGFLVSPLVPEEKIGETVDQIIKSAIEAGGGVVISQIFPKLRPLAYNVSKFFANKKVSFRDAYFGSIKFYSLPEKIGAAKDTLDKTGEVIRYLLITVPKNADKVSAPRRTAIKKVVPAGGEKEERQPINKEDIDKEIEGLLTSVNN